MARRNSSELIEELFCVLPSSQRENFSSHLYIPYSRKVHRRVYCYGHSAYDLWVQLESDPTVLLFNEQFEDIAFSINEKKFTAKPLFASKSQSEKSAIVTLHFFVQPTADDMEDDQVPATEKEGAMLDWGKQNGIASEYRARFGDSPDTKLTIEDVTSLVYAHDIRSLRQKLSDYLNTKQSVWILFDNLDKGWNTGGVDDIDVIVLRCLVEAGRKIEREMRKRDHDLYCVIFVRNDVYELLMQGSSDYGKDMRAVLDWTDPDMLREMLRLRLVSGMDGVDPNATFEKIWRDICISHVHGEDTSAYFIERSLMRPRNVLKIFAHSKGFANNFNHLKIEESDIEKGVKAFSQDLLVELDHELSDVCPGVPDLLYHFIDHPSEASRSELALTLRGGGVGEDQIEKIFSFLLYYGVIGLKTQTGVQYIFDVNYDSKILTTRAQRLGEDARYVFNPAFWDALGIANLPLKISNPS